MDVVFRMKAEAAKWHEPVSPKCSILDLVC